MRMVATASGVHVSTVSRALSAKHATGGLNETEERILRTVREMGYVPNPNAASLTTLRSTAFGVLVPQLADTVLAQVYDAAEAAANNAGYETFVANTHDSPTEQSRRIRLLLGRSVDGLILGDAHVDGSNLAELRDEGVNFVLVSRTCQNYLSVSGDDEQGGRLVGEHLAELGHSRIGIVGGSPWASTSVDRVRGCLAAIADAGLEPRPYELISSGGFGVADGRLGAQKLLALSDPPTAIFAVNDMSAIGVMGVLRERGITPGHDVAVVGYNDLPLASSMPIPLTTVHSPLEQMGSEAVRLLLAQLDGKSTESLRLNTRLVVRESSVGARN